MEKIHQANVSSGEVDTCADEVPGGIFVDQYINGTGEGQVIQDNTPAARSLIGHKEDRTRPQCSYDCLLLQECVAISWRADLTDDKDLLKTGTCFLFKQVLGNIL